MSTCIFKNNRIIPCPFVSFQKEFIKTEDQTIIGSTWKISLIGKIVSFKGSPMSNMTFYTGSGYPPDENITPSGMLTANIRKQEALRTLFNKDNDGGLLEVGGSEGNPPFQANIKIDDISFQESEWLNTVDYTINLSADNLSINGQALPEDNYSNFITSASETWSLETDEGAPEGVGLPRTYHLNHSVSARGIRHYDSNGNLSMPSWQQARGYVVPKIGLDSSKLISSGVPGIAAYMTGNHIRNEVIDENAGEYSISESWLLTSGTATEEFTCESRKSIEDGLTHVTIQGQVQGVEYRDANMNILSLKYQNADSYFSGIYPTLLGRAQLYSSTTLNIVPISQAIGKNPILGNINFNVEYNNRPSNLIPGSRSEVIQIQDSLQNQLIAIVPVLARSQGPVLQPMGTNRETSRTLNLEVVMEMPSTPYSGIVQMLNSNPFLVNSQQYSIIKSIIDTVDPLNSFSASQSYLVENSQNYDPKTLRGNITKTWVYEI